MSYKDKKIIRVHGLQAGITSLNSTRSLRRVMREIDRQRRVDIFETNSNHHFNRRPYESNWVSPTQRIARELERIGEYFVFEENVRVFDASSNEARGLTLEEASKAIPVIKNDCQNPIARMREQTILVNLGTCYSYLTIINGEVSLPRVKPGTPGALQNGNHWYARTTRQEDLFKEEPIYRRNGQKHIA